MVSDDKITTENGDVKDTDLHSAIYVLLNHVPAPAPMTILSRSIPATNRATFVQLRSMLAENHSLKLKRCFMQSRYEKLLAHRDRQFVQRTYDAANCPDSFSSISCSSSHGDKGDQDRLSIWALQAMNFTQSFSRFAENEFKDHILDDRLCVYVNYSDGKFEQLDFGSQRHKCLIRVSVKRTDDGDYTVESDIELSVLKEAVLKFLNQGESLDCFVYKGLWPLMDEVVFPRDLLK